MQKLKSWTSSAGTSPLSRTQRLHHSSALLAANTRAQSEIREPATPCADDPRGRALRQLREHHQVDAVQLATQACISLRQLYQLETGEVTLFYNTNLRDQAGRRVASLLGVEWETLGQTPLRMGADKVTKVVNLHPALAVERPAPVNAHAAVDTAAPSANHAQAAPSVAVETSPIGLQREATETLTLPTPTNAQIRISETTNDPARPRPRRWLRTFMLWTLSATAGTAIGLLIATQTPLGQPLNDLLEQLRWPLHWPF